MRLPLHQSLNQLHIALKLDNIGHFCNAAARHFKDLTVVRKTGAGCARNQAVTLLFSAFQDPNNTIPCEHSEVKAFPESLQGRCRCVAYRNAAELKEKVTETLQAQMSASSH